MKIATWNVNSIRVRLPRLVAWLRRIEPDVVCLQETKVIDEDFPAAELEELGYKCLIDGQKTYNGVAILSRLEMTDPLRNFPGAEPDSERRLLAATVAGIRVVDIYAPNGGFVGSDRYGYKLEWFRRLRLHLDSSYGAELPLLVCGDFNVAPEDRDVYDPEKLRGTVLFHPEEQARLAAICGIGLRDAFRIHNQEAGQYSWWDYRGGAFHRGHGYRIDFLLASAPLAEACRSVVIERDERKGPQPSDHAPVVGDFGL